MRKEKQISKSLVVQIRDNEDKELRGKALPSIQFNI